MSVSRSHARLLNMKRLIFALGFFVSLTASAQSDTPKVDITLFDSYNLQHGLRAPSMQQSLSATATTYDLTHLALQNAFGEKHPRLNKTAVALFDGLTTAVTPLPLTDAWLHEEWHRAVMGNRGIDSFDDVYKFQFGANAINVSHVRDEDLIRLKAEHPADLVRLDEAGVEGETMLAQRLEKERFFDRSTAWHLPLYWLLKIGVQGYIASGADRQSDVDTDDANAREGADIKRRDFTGHDFLGWIYDLSRPDEPYAARGIHPSGVGINRYRKTTDLTAEELHYLDRQGKLSWLNFADTNLIGIDRFRTGGVEWNVAGAHYLTSFGYTLDANVFLRTENRKLFITLHDYVNRQRNFPGVDVELVDHRVSFRGRELRVTPRVALWSQPDGQQFRTSEARLGALAGVRVDGPAIGRYAAYVAVDAKTAGWVAGEEHLDSSVAVRIGVTRTLF